MSAHLTDLSHRRGGSAILEWLFFAAYPLFLAGEVLKRSSNTPEDDSDLSKIGRRSAFAEARDTLMISLSYFLMARETSKAFVRRTRTERPL
jgi:hypothetical protein